MVKPSKVQVPYPYFADGSRRSRRVYSSYKSQQKKIDELLQKNVCRSPPTKVAPVPLHLRCIQATPPGFDSGRDRSPPRMYSSYRSQIKKNEELRRNSHGFPPNIHRVPTMMDFGCIRIRQAPPDRRIRNTPIGMTILVPVQSKKSHDCDTSKNIRTIRFCSSGAECKSNKVVVEPYVNTSTSSSANKLSISKHTPTYDRHDNVNTNQNVLEQKNKDLTFQENDEDGKRVIETFRFHRNVSRNNVQEEAEEKSKQMENTTYENTESTVQESECYRTTDEGNVTGKRPCRSSNQNVLEGKYEHLVIGETHCKTETISRCGEECDNSIDEGIYEHAAGKIPNRRSPPCKSNDISVRREVQDVENDNSIDKEKVQREAVRRFELGNSISNYASEKGDAVKMQLSVIDCYIHKGVIFILPWY